GGAVLSPAVQVRVTEALGNAVPGRSVSLALVGTGTLTGGGPMASDGNGVASFASLKVDVAGSKQLAAASGALPVATSNAFAVSPGPAAALAFVVQPASAGVGATLSPAVQVKVTDASGNAVSGAAVSLALVGTGTLAGGGPTASDAGGVASFAALSVNRAGSKQLTATSAALPPTTSGTFTVSCPVVTVSPAALPNGSVNSPYLATLGAAGGQSP